MIPILLFFVSLINVGISQDFTPDFCQPEQVRLSVRGKLQGTQWCRNRGGQGGHWLPEYFAEQLTLFKPGRADYPNYYYWPPQFFSPPGITEYIFRIPQMTLR